MAKIDIRAFRLNLDGTVTQVLADKDTGGTTITGVDKLAQRVVTELMTRQGTIPFKTLRGTKFIQFLSGGTIINERDVFVAFAAARADILNNIQNEDLVTDPLDEQLKDVELLQIALTGTSLVLQIKVLSKAETLVITAWPLNFIF